jgi:hypothetical protein
MARTLPFGFQSQQQQPALRPALDVSWSDRYGGRPVLRDGGQADDGLVTNHAALAVVGTTLIQLKSRGSAVEVQRRNATTLAITSAWTNLATAVVGDVPVGLTLSGSDLLAMWRDGDTEVRYRRSTDGGATWATEAALHLAAGTNTLHGILTSPDGLVAVEERQTASTALLHSYTWDGAAWTLLDTHDTGATALHGGGCDTEGGTFVVYAGDFVQPSTAGTVSLRQTRVYDLDAGAALGTLHQGSDGGVRWRDVRAAYLPTAQTHYVLATVQVPRGSGDASDRVALFPYGTGRIGAHHPLGPPRVVYAVEDTESAAVAVGPGAVYVMAGSFVQRLVEGNAGSTATVSSLDLEVAPDDERLRVGGPGALSSDALQLRVRLGLGATLVDMGVFWLSGRVAASREGWQGAAYGAWGMLRRERQQMSCALVDEAGNALAPGDILEIIFNGLGFLYSEDPSLNSTLHPSLDARMSWTLRYGRDYASLVRGLLRWTGCELRTGVAADGTTPTAHVFRPGSRFGPTPAAAVHLGGSGNHPALEVVSVDPETITDVTIFPGGWDHQLPLADFVDRQLMLEASEARGVVWDTTPATRALARALAGAEAGMVRARPALEIELWDTVLVTDTPAGLLGARRLVRSLALAAGQGRWEMRLTLGLE